jgi:hypothetical protein
VEDWRECRNEYVELGVTRESELRSYRPILPLQVVYIKGTHESYDLIEESPCNCTLLSQVTFLQLLYISWCKMAAPKSNIVLITGANQGIVSQ